MKLRNVNCELRIERRQWRVGRLPSQFAIRNLQFAIAAIFLAASTFVAAQAGAGSSWKLPRATRAQGPVIGPGGRGGIGSAPSPRLFAAPDSRLKTLFSAIRQVESRGNDSAVGDRGRSRGPYQIQVAYWTEACRFGGVQWDYLHWVNDRGRCEQVMRWYWVKHGATTDQARARIHNGGPGGMRKAATVKYWAKVKRQMQPQRAQR